MNLLTQDTCPIPDYCTSPNCSHTKLEKRFWAKVNIGKLDECWEWNGYFDTSDYGHLGIMKNGKRTTVKAHRLAYELLVGPIPPRLVIDHLCRNRRCVNPFHLEVVTLKENISRGEGITAINAKKTHCKYGHPLSGDNLYIIPKTGNRACNICHRMQGRKYDHKQSAYRRLRKQTTFS